MLRSFFSATVFLSRSFSVRITQEHRSTLCHDFAPALSASGIMFHQHVRQLRLGPAAGILVLSSLLTCVGTAMAQTPAEALYRDLRQTVQARKLLLDDPSLGPLNLGVKVSSHKAVLWGPVPSQELAARAEQRLRSMFELAEIYNRLTIEPDDGVTPPAPDSPRLLPEHLPPAAPQAPRPLQVPDTARVALAGIVTPEETITARSSPLGGSTRVAAAATALHLPFLGSVNLPR
jgi:hypothetical protein